MGDLLVGTASWTDKTLLESGWYPSSVRSAAERLAHYASHFPIVEVDSTYYSPPAERTVELWRDRTPAEFTFNVKAFSLLTNHPTRPTALYADLRERIGTKAGNLYLRDLDDATIGEVWDRFLSALAPLHDAGKLGALLLQFPPWFGIRRSNKDYIVECQRRCDPVRICVEFRNRSWMTEENQAETLGFLARHSIPYVCVDMPQGFRDSIPPVLATTADLAVVRFHGHSQKWTSRNIYDRFGYLYSEDELSEWVPKLRDLAERSDVLQVFMNNCYRDYAQRNAGQLLRLLNGGPGAAQDASLAGATRDSAAIPLVGISAGSDCHRSADATALGSWWRQFRRRPTDDHAHSSYVIIVTLTCLLSPFVRNLHSHRDYRP